MKKSIEKLLDIGKEYERIVIFGAGVRGRELLEILVNKGLNVCAIFDNNPERTGNRMISGIPVVLPKKIEGTDVLYVTSIADPYDRIVLKQQLLRLGVYEEEIFEYDPREYEYLSHLDESEYKNELDSMYFKVFGRNINWDDPKRYTEKINCEKLVRDKRKTNLTDKYLVKEWVKNTIGENHCINTLGVWDSADEIDFENLPKQFVLKLNNASASNIVVRDKNNIDIDAIRGRLSSWIAQNYGYRSLELHYRDIVPKIICEEYIHGLSSDCYDYKIYCFHGKPYYIECIRNAIHYDDASAVFYDTKWDKQKFTFGYPKEIIDVPKPDDLDKMIEFSTVLSKDFPHVRVDLYDLPYGKVLFGEMTFTSWGGLMRFTPDEWDEIFGSLI